MGVSMVCVARRRPERCHRDSLVGAHGCDVVPRHGSRTALEEGALGGRGKMLFKEGETNCVLMTGIALTYRLVKPPGIVAHYTVNHSEHEYSRSEDILRDVVTKE